jgi:hypothetical protein
MTTQFEINIKKIERAAASTEQIPWIASENAAPGYVGDLYTIMFDKNGWPGDAMTLVCCHNIFDSLEDIILDIVIDAQKQK